MKTDYFSKEAMRKKMEEILEMARGNLQQSGYLMPVVILLKEDENNLNADLVQLDYRDETHKRATTTALKVKMAMDNVDGYIMITEAWMGVLEKGEVIRVRPSENPDRQEGICIAGATPLLSLSLTQVFHRAENGNGPKFEFEEETFAERTDSIFYPEHWKNKN
jgi:hypothetical protein